MISPKLGQSNPKFYFLCSFWSKMSSLQDPSVFQGKAEGICHLNILTSYPTGSLFVCKTQCWRWFSVNSQHTHISQWNTITSALLQRSSQGVCNNSFWTYELCVLNTSLGCMYFTCQVKFFFPTNINTPSPLIFFVILNKMPNIFIMLVCVPVWPWPVCSGALISNNNSLSWQPMYKQHSFILTWQQCHSLSVVLSVCLCLSLPLYIFLPFCIMLF